MKKKIEALRQSAARSTAVSASESGDSVPLVPIRVSAGGARPRGIEEDILSPFDSIGPPMLPPPAETTPAEALPPPAASSNTQQHPTRSTTDAGPKRGGAGRLADMDMQTICDILCPDALLPTFRQVPSIAAHVLHRYQLTAAARSDKIISEMSSTEADGAEDVGVAVEHLAQACESYIRRYKKRMELLQQYSEDTTQRSNLGARAWCQRVQDYYARPLSTPQGRWLFLFHALLGILTLTSLTLRTVPSVSPRLRTDTAAAWSMAEGFISGFMFLDVLTIFLANLFDPERPLTLSMKLYVTSLSNCFDVAALILPTIRIASGTSAVTGVTLGDAQSNLTVNQTAAIVSGGGGNFGFDSAGDLIIVGSQEDPLLLFRLLRTFRLMRALRHFYAFEDLFETLKRSAVPLIGPIVAVLIFVVGFASIVYTMEAGSYRENNLMFMVRNEDCEMRPSFVLGLEACDRQESKFLSIFHTMWFTLIALLTIGYGDIVPKTFFGRLISLVCIVLGQLLMAMPIAIIGNKFTYVVTNLKGERRAVLQYIEDRKQQQDDLNMRTALLGGTDALMSTTTAVASGSMFGLANAAEVDGEFHSNSAEGAQLARQRHNNVVTFPDDDVAAVHRECLDFPTTHICTDDGKTVVLVAPSLTLRDVCQVSLPSSGQGSPGTAAVGIPVECADGTKASAEQGGAQQVAALVPSVPTLPSVMFCRFLQFATKQQTLDLTAADRLVVYAVEVFIRNAAKRYLRHTAAGKNMHEVGGENPTTTMSNQRGVAPPLPSADPTRGGMPLARHLVLLHPDVSNVVALPPSVTYRVGADVACEVQLRDPLVRALAMSVYSEKPRRELGQQQRGGGSSGARTLDLLGVSARSSAGVPTAAMIASNSSGTPTSSAVALRQCYAIAPTHCRIKVVHGRSPLCASSSMFIENPRGNTVLVNDQSLAHSDERYLREGDVIRYTKVADGISTTIRSKYAYDFDTVVRGDNE